ncbi:MAG: peptidase S41 [Candidatus Omnitrophica bacterium CG_4_10_14_0_2_um_filter_44_9]|nr:MAG: peptidase S41 [Candidatus Omnitrophica bacterium CG_4_10_14_0_8_um_filter_44_12]PIZ83300.1 MAG: peptidase S41 [Candidatus Omnitrophica bacterium CG_4_10_14_0_2_um_filter_44_9]
MLKMCRKVFIFFCVAFFLASLSSLAISGIDRSKKSGSYKELDLFADALAVIQAQYADDTKPKDLIYGAMAGMLDHLDPHSQFLPPEEYEELKVETEGKFGGIGIEITVKDNLVTVITPIEDTPAWEAGLQTNDRIVKIDDVVIRNFTLNEAVKKLRGKPGAEVNVVIWREKENKLHSYKIKRAIIAIKDIKEAKILEDHIAYLKLVEFREDTPKELDRALKGLNKLGMDSLVLDLRNNPGGLLDMAIATCEMFLPKGALIVSIKGRDTKQNAEYKANLKTPYAVMPLVLLVNEGSASGSEIVAGALQDNQRAIILGVTTFGKGSVQTVFPLKDGSALKLTTSRYFTPKGISIHQKGITPDIVVGSKEPVDVVKEAVSKDDAKAYEAIFEGVEDKKLKSESGPRPLQEFHKEAHVSDPALERAVDILKSLKIYKSFVK